MQSLETEYPSGGYPQANPQQITGFTETKYDLKGAYISDPSYPNSIESEAEYGCDQHQDDEEWAVNQENPDTDGRTKKNNSKEEISNNKKHILQE